LSSGIKFDDQEGDIKMHFHYCDALLYTTGGYEAYKEVQIEDQMNSYTVFAPSGAKLQTITSPSSKMSQKELLLIRFNVPDPETIISSES
jgi:hypothetical protein